MALLVRDLSPGVWLDSVDVGKSEFVRKRVSGGRWRERNRVG